MPFVSLLVDPHRETCLTRLTVNPPPKEKKRSGRGCVIV